MRQIGPVEVFNQNIFFELAYFTMVPEISMLYSETKGYRVIIHTFDSLRLKKSRASLLFLIFLRWNNIDRLILIHPSYFMLLRGQSSRIKYVSGGYKSEYLEAYVEKKVFTLYTSGLS